MKQRRLPLYMGRFALRVVMGFLPSSLAAEPAPIELVAQSLEATNLHLAGSEGAINFRRKVRLQLRLFPDHRLRGEEVGERRENNLYRDRSTQDESQWRQTYSGRWSYVGSGLRLDLERGERRCTRRKTDNNQPPGETLSCASVSPTLRLDCQSERLQLSDPDAPGAAAGAHPQEAWRCVLASPSEVGDSVLPWIFGKGRCIETSPRYHSMPASYRPCRQ